MLGMTPILCYRDKMVVTKLGYSNKMLDMGLKKHNSDKIVDMTPVLLYKVKIAELASKLCYNFKMMDIARVKYNRDKLVEMAPGLQNRDKRN